MKNEMIRVFKIWLVLLGLLQLAFAERIDENGKRYIRVGSLQSHVSAYGSERAWNNSYYEGLIWPADYLRQDNAVIKRSFFGVKNFVDETNYKWDYWASYGSLGYVEVSLFPVKLKQYAKFEHPNVFVDGQSIYGIYAADVDSIDENQIPDRIVENTINTKIGLTITRRFLAFSQQYHDNYFIKEWILTNTGNTDWDDEIELDGPLEAIRIGWSTRYSCGRDGAYTMADGSQSWGKHSWVTKRGENYAEHMNDVITEDNPVVDWIRAGFSYLGLNELNTDYDNIGAPYLTQGGRLASPHHVGTAILHVPKSATNPEDDPNQPAVLGWHAGDTSPSPGGITPGNMPGIIATYQWLEGVPYGGEGMGGTGRFDEENNVAVDDPYTIHGDGGGTNVWITYGPFDLEWGQSLTFVEAEGVSGLSRPMCEEIGRIWKEAKDNPDVEYTFSMPDDESTIKGKYKDGVADQFKNAWVFTGQDSIMKTFGRAKRNFDAGYNIPQPPLPPPVFTVNSGGDRISLEWSASPSENESDFAGYRIYRAVGKPDTIHTRIAELPAGTYSYDDVTAVRGYDYYYYITAFNDGSNNTAGLLNPTGPLESGRFYTKTTQPAYLRRQQGTDLDKIRIVPNPFNISAKDMQFKEQPDRIMFYNIPGKCVIKIFSERGDLIETIHHTNGSGDEAWNSVSSARQVIVSGLYIAYFEVTEDIVNESTGELLFKEGDNTMKKFIIVR